jgi:hypothetical protein
VLTTNSFSFSFSRNPYHLSSALARWRRMVEPDHEAIVSAGDNSWAESRFLVELLLHAQPRRKWLDRECASEILRAAGSTVTLESLEKRFWVRFIVGHLEIPGGIRAELAQRKHEDALPDAERDALQRLVAVRDDKTPLFWIERSQLEQIHAVHSGAHRRTPTLSELEKSHASGPATHEALEGYVLPWCDRGNGGLSPWLCTRVLGLYWEALAGEASRRVDEAKDDAAFHKWLAAAFEFYWFTSPTDHMTNSMRARLIKAAKRCVIKDTDVIDPDDELERFLWETVGFDRPSRLRIPPKPTKDSSLLDVYQWFNHAALHEPTGLRSLRERLDILISLIVHHDADIWQYNVVDILHASRQKPYLMYYATLSMQVGRSVAIAGLVAHVDTASLGMLLLAERNAPVENFNWEEPSNCARIQETEQNRIWREAVGVLLGTVREELPTKPKECARALGETFLLSVPGNSRRKHMAHVADLEDILRQGTEKRLQILLQELSTTRHFVLLPLAVDIHSFLSDRIEKRQCTPPSAEVRILLWLLRTLTEVDYVAPAPDNIASTIVDAYKSVLLRKEVNDEGRLVIWDDDAPDMVDLPWVDLAMFLERRGRVDELLAPEGVNFDAQLSESYQSKQYGGGNEHRTWVRKTRLHLRVLFTIHEGLPNRDFDPVLGLPVKQSHALIARIEQEIALLVSTCAKSAHDRKHGSLFAPDSSTFAAGIRGSEGILAPILRIFNRFRSAEKRDVGFSDWIAVENDPTVLLTIYDRALSPSARDRAATRLNSINFENIAADMSLATQLEELAMAANVANQPEVVFKILAYGSKHLQPSYRENEWAIFDYEMRLMIAYHRRSEAELDAVQLPPNPQRYQRRLDMHIQDDIVDKREFYRGLIVLDNDPSKARKIFVQLAAKYPGSVSYAVNLTAASLEWAKQVEDPEERQRAFRRVLREWESMEQTIPATALASVQKNVAGIRLLALDGAKDDDTFDAAWANLKTETRADIDIVTISVTNARRRGLQERANVVLGVARQYYVDTTGKVDERFARLEKESAAPQLYSAATTVRTLTDELEAHHAAFQKLRNSRANRAVQVLGGSGTSVDKFLMDELLEIAKELMKRKILFGAGHEPRRNDLFASLLQMRFALLRWTVTEGRGGLSRVGRDAGLRDWVLTNSGCGGEIAIFEALVLKGVKSKYLDEHVDKTVFDYDPSGLGQAYVVVYYKGKSPFQKFWGRYLDHVRSKELRGLSPRNCSEPYANEPLRKIAVACLDYVRDGVPHVVYHMALDLTS